MSSRSDDPPRVGAGPRVEPGASSSPAARGSAVVAADEPLTHESFRSVLSTHERAGRWEPADEIEASAILGTVRVRGR